MTNYTTPIHVTSVIGGQLVSSSNPLPTSTAYYAVKLDDTSTTNVTYVGLANPGTLSSAASWQIKKIDETTGLVITFADGDSGFDNVWDNRVSLTYS